MVTVNLVRVLEQALTARPPSGSPTVVRRGEPSGNSYEAANIASTPTIIRRATVPRNCVWGPNLSEALVLLLPYVETVAFAGTHVATNTTYRPTRIPRLDEEGEADGEFQRVALLADATPRTITAVGDHIDGTQGTITCSDDTAADHQVAYLPYAAGRVKVFARTPGTVGEYRRLLFDRDLAQVHASNQRKEGRLRLPCYLPEDYSIEVELTAAWVWATAMACTLNDFNIPFATINLPVTLFGLEQFAVRGETRIGDTLKTLAREKIAGF